MRLVSKKVFTQAVVASTLLCTAQLSFAVDITTDVTTTQTAGTLNVSPAPSFSGTIDAGGADNAIAPATAATINIFQTTSKVADGFTVRSADGNAINYTIALPATIKIFEKAKVTTTGTGSIFSTNVVTNQLFSNAGELTTTGTGNIISSNASGNLSVSNATTGIMRAAKDTHLITELVAGTGISISNSGLMEAQGTGSVVSNLGGAPTFTNSGIVRADPLVATALDYNAVGAEITNTGTITAATAIKTAFKVTQKGGVINGKMEIDGAASTLTISGGTINGNTTMITPGNVLTVTINPAAGVVPVVNGSITSLAAVPDALTVANNSAVILNGALTNYNVTLGKNSTLSLNNSILTAGSLTTDQSTLNVNRAINIPGTFLLDLNSNLNLTLNDKNNFGQINSGGASTLTGKINVLLGDGYIFNNDTFNLVNSAAPIVNTPTLVFPRSAIHGFTTTINANNVIVTASRRTFNSFVGTSGLIAGIANELDRLGNTFTQPGFVDALRALEKLPSADRVVDALTQLAPRVDGASIHGVINAQSAANETVNKRLTVARAGDDLQEGYNAGGYSAGAADGMVVWLQAYGNSSNQDLRRQVPGYRAKTLGGALGLDKALTDSFRLGVAVNHGTTNTKAKIIPTTSHQIQSYGAIVYASHSGESAYLDALYSYATNMFHSVRRLNFGLLNQSIDSDHRGSQMSLNLTWGKPLFHRADKEGFEASTSVTASWDRVKERAYTERNTTGLNLRIQRVIDNSAMLKANLKFDYYYGTELGTLIPSVKAGVGYDVLSQKPSVTAAFMPGGANFRTLGAQRSRIAAFAGAGVVLVTDQKTRVDLSYDLESRQNYLSHSGMFTVRYVY